MEDLVETKRIGIQYIDFNFSIDEYFENSTIDRKNVCWDTGIG